LSRLGPTAVVLEIAKIASKLIVIQRSPAWVIPATIAGSVLEEKSVRRGRLKLVRGSDRSRSSLELAGLGKS